MSTTTVRTMLTAILDNKMQMDDEICIALSEHASQIYGKLYALEHIKTEVWQVEKQKTKTLAFVFGLNEQRDDE